MKDNFTIIYPQNDNSNNYIENLAFIRALFIKKYVEKLNISNEDKYILWDSILNYLKNT